LRFWLVLAQSRLQNLVDCDAVSLTVITCGEESTVLDSDDLQILHGETPLQLSRFRTQNAMRTAEQRGITRARRKLTWTERIAEVRWFAIHPGLMQTMAADFVCSAMT
jgi:hypothetical protein